MKKCWHIIAAIAVLGAMSLYIDSHAQGIQYLTLRANSWNDNIGLLECIWYRDTISGEILSTEKLASACVNESLGTISMSSAGTRDVNGLLVVEGFGALAHPLEGDESLSRFIINFLNVEQDNTLRGRIDSQVFGPFFFEGAKLIEKMNVARTAQEAERLDISDLARAFAIQNRKTSFTAEDIWRINLSGQDSTVSWFIFDQLNKGLTAQQILQKYITDDDLTPIRDHVLQSLDNL